VGGGTTRRWLGVDVHSLLSVGSSGDSSAGGDAMPWESSAGDNSGSSSGSCERKKIL
jgi:hypothetical protein